MRKRIPRVNQLIKKELSQIILREIDFPKDVLVTVTQVETSADLNIAKVFISVLPEDKTPLILENLNKQIYFLQQELNHRLKMRPIPRITFKEEKKILEASRIEEVLVKLNKEKK